MATQVYKVDGQRVPSVTTIISRFKESGGLVHWAWELGVSGKDYRQERQKAADSGTLAHDMVEAHIHGREWEPSGKIDKEVLDKAQGAFKSYLTWAEMADVDVRHTEVPLVSQTHKFGGCLDAIGVCRKMSNGLVLLDWKTSNSLYADYLYQLAAYGLLWNENYPETPVDSGYHLLRFSKENGDFSHMFFPSLDEEAQTFLAMRSLYDQVKKTEKRVR